MVARRGSAERRFHLALLASRSPCVSCIARIARRVSNVEITRRISEIAVAIIVGCMPVLPQFYFYLRGRSLNNVSASPGGIQQHHHTLGGSDRKRRNLGSLGTSIAKYMGPGGLGLVTLPGRKSDEEIQLRLNDDAIHPFGGSEQSSYHVRSS